MQVIIEWFQWLGDLVTSLFKFFVDTIEGLVYIVQLLTYFITKIPDYFAWLPSEFLTIVVLIFGVAVTYKILGREG